MDIIELRYLAVQCHLAAIRCDDPQEVLSYRSRGIRYTKLADAMNEFAKATEYEPARSNCS